ncbi:MAG: motility protein A [Planctomycetaceae bacterium]|nr:motility protein A [Planctomycetaceae bacterium]
MDKATIGGIAAAWGILLVTILIAPGAKLSAFWDSPSLLCVCGGAVCAVMIAFPLNVMFKVPKIYLKAFFPKTADIGPVIKQLVQFAEIARKDGILALEGKTDQIKDPFILMGIQMAVDGTDAELMETIMRTEMEAIFSRHKTGKGVLDTLNKYAPAFGMIGTLLGLIIMLGNMDDPAAIGPGMAVALLTTLYGAIVSNIMCAPIADKLALYSRKEMELKELIIRGILSIQGGDNPRVLEQKVLTFLPGPERKKIESKAA